MAKKRSSPESAEDLTGVSEERQVSIKTVNVKIPLMSGVNGYETSNVYCRFKGSEKTSLKAALMALVDEGARLDDGTIVKTHQHVLRYIVQQMNQ